MPKKLAILVSVALVICASIGVGSASAAPTCDGKSATHVVPSGGATFRGTNGNDVIVGSSAQDFINSLGGNDTICGHGGADVVHGGRGNDKLLGGRGYDNLYGDEDDDELISGRGSSLLSGGAGNDTITGVTGGFDSLEFVTARGPMIVDLGAGTATGEGNDTITDVESVRGTNFDDSLTGDDTPNSLIGMGGDDLLVGGGGGVLSGPGAHTSSFGRADVYYGVGGNDTFVGSDDYDVVSWFDAPAPITVDLAAGTATGEGDDTLTNIDGVHSSRNADTIRGDANDNAFALEGSSQVVDGRGGVDLVFITDYAPNGVTVDLEAGTVTGGQGDDSLTSIENVWGTQWNDTLVGDDNANQLKGRGGNDSLFGGAGDDTLIGGRGRDSFDGGDGFDLCEQPPERGLINCENP